MRRRALRVVIALGVIALAVQLRSVGIRQRAVAPLVARSELASPSWVPRPASDRAFIYTMGGGNIVLDRDTKRGGR